MKTTRLAIPEYKGRISPLFDVAGKFILADTDTGRRELLDTNCQKSERIIKTLWNANTKIVICSSISRYSARLLCMYQIEIIPGIIGDVDEIINAYTNNQLETDIFAMPGCRWKQRYRGRRCPFYREIFKDSDQSEN